MRGLLLKDWLVIGKQAKLYFVMMAVFALVPGMGVYSIFFGALLPVTAFSFDERSRWDTMARMMPYSDLDVVVEKYVFGYILVGSVILLETVIQAVYCLSGVSSLGIGESMKVILLPTAAALTVMALQISVIFGMGVEKTRMFLMFLTIGVMLMLQSAYLTNIGFEEETVMLPEVDLPTGLVVLGVTLAVQLVSLKVSEKLYRRRQGKRGRIQDGIS